jgi:deoxyribodipyrimidine photo-lyase
MSAPTPRLPSRVPDARIRPLNDRPLRADGEYVLYWMVAARRSRDSFALERAVDLARALERPLVVLEALRAGYPYASDRLHRFVLDGMTANARALARSPVLYHPYVEPEPGAGRGLVEALAGSACAVVTDDYPTFFLPRMLAAAATRLNVRLEAVDGNGLVPMRDARKAFATAYHFRRYLQSVLPTHLRELPRQNPLARVRLPRLSHLPARVTRRWPAASPHLLGGDVAALPIDHDVAPVKWRGGAQAGQRRLRRFLTHGLQDYDERRNHPDLDAGSGLSPYLHFGHLSAHQVIRELARRDGWTPDDVTDRRDGRRVGWWALGPAAEAFVDQLVTWRELGFNWAAHREDHAGYGSLPDWARRTLEKHAGDRREHLYTLEQFEAADTHEPLWNAAQRQLLREGRIHNYLRMLWGKKIVEWTRSPREAHETMVALNDRWALDGRDPNSYTGILWVLGRHDRPWAPERPVFGTVRWMSERNTQRKVRCREYVARYGAPV